MGTKTREVGPGREENDQGSASSEEQIPPKTVREVGGSDFDETDYDSRGPSFAKLRRGDERPLRTVGTSSCLLREG